MPELKYCDGCEGHALLKFRDHVTEEDRLAEALLATFYQGKEVDDAKEQAIKDARALILGGSEAGKVYARLASDATPERLLDLEGIFYNAENYRSFGFDDYYASQFLWALDGARTVPNGNELLELPIPAKRLLKATDRDKLYDQDAMRTGFYDYFKADRKEVDVEQILADQIADAAKQAQDQLKDLIKKFHYGSLKSKKFHKMKIQDFDPEQIQRILDGKYRSKKDLYRKSKFSPLPPLPDYEELRLEEMAERFAKRIKELEREFEEQERERQEWESKRSSKNN